MENELASSLIEYFSKREDVSLAYFFGSASRGEVGALSDVDVAVYFKSPSGHLEYQSDTAWYDAEGEILSDLEKMTKRKVDLVVLNRSSAKIVYSAVRGIELKNHDQLTASTLFGRSMFDAIDFRYLSNQYYETFARSQSLNPIDKDRLQRVVDLLEIELSDLIKLQETNQLEYSRDRAKKRNFDRTVENVCNMTFDITRIILGSNKIPAPDTYRDLVLKLSTVDNFNSQMAERLAVTSAVRNLLAHQYDDIRFNGLISFISKTKGALEYLLEFTRGYIKNN